MRIPAMIIAAVTLSSTLFAAPADLWFEKANGFYQAEALDSAEAYYLKVAESGILNSALFYNLGNVYFRQHKLGHAILQWERARQLAPTDPDIEHNLRYARANVVDRIPDPERSFFEAVLRSFHSFMPLDAQLWLLTALMLMLACLFALGLYVSHNVRLWLVYAGCIAGLLITAVGASAGKKIHDLERVKHAVVLVASVDARNGPKGDKVLFTAHEGSTFQVRQKMGAWWFVSLPNGVSGWVESSALGEI